MSRTQRASILAALTLVAVAYAVGQQASASPSYGQVKADIKSYVGKKVTWNAVLATDQESTTAGRTEHTYIFMITPAVPPDTVSRFGFRVAEPLRDPRGTRIVLPGMSFKVTGTISGARKYGKGNESPELKDVSIATP